MIDIAIVVALLLLGYGFGTYREKAHYASIRKRERELADILIFESRFPAELNPSLKPTPSTNSALTTGGVLNAATTTTNLRIIIMMTRPNTCGMATMPFPKVKKLPSSFMSAPDAMNPT